MSFLFNKSATPVVLVFYLFCATACKQIVPNADIPKLINDTGINITVTFNPNGGTWPDGTVADIKQVGNSGSPLVHPKTPEHNEKIFNGWNTENGTIPAIFPARNTVYTALYRPLGSDEAFYTVEYWREKKDGSEFELDEHCKKIGKTNSAPVYEIKTFEGFDYAPPQSVIPATIDGSGSTRVELKYVRKHINLTLDLDGGTMDPPSTPTFFSGKFGAAVPPVNNPTKPGYDFAGWNTADGTLPQTFPAEDTTYKALWEKSNIIKNADFSQTQAPSGDYASYWKTQSPVYWTTKGKKNIEGVEFRVENAAFSVTAGSTKLETGGIEQTLMLPDTTDGTTYTLSLTMKIEKQSGSKGGGSVRLAGKPVLKKYSGTHPLDKTITVKGTNIEFTDDSGNPVSAPLSGSVHNELKLELLSNGIENLNVVFSNIKCIQG